MGNALALALNVPPPLAGLSFIEQLHALCSCDCPSIGSVWVVGVNHTSKNAVVFTPPCKRWACVSCGAKNGKRWLARIINGINELDGEWSMLTITANGTWRGKTASLVNLRQGWRKLYNRMLRQLGKRHYALVWEFHKDASLHIHILFQVAVNATLKYRGKRDRKTGILPMPKMLALPRWLKDTAAQCGMGYQTEAHEIENAGQAAGYVAKYLLKGMALSQQYPANIRRIVVSQGFPELPDLTKGKFKGFAWVRCMTDIGALRTLQPFWDRGYDIHGGDNLEYDTDL